MRIRELRADDGDALRALWRAIGALAGFDGRRGWLYHVATHPDARREAMLFWSAIGYRRERAVEFGRELIAE